MTAKLQDAGLVASVDEPALMSAYGAALPDARLLRVWVVESQVDEARKRAGRSPATMRSDGRDDTGAAIRDAEAVFVAEGCSPPAMGERSRRHVRVARARLPQGLFCLEGSIVFHTRDGDVVLASGDRLDLDPGTEHAATVGRRAVAASRPPGEGRVPRRSAVVQRAGRHRYVRP